MERERSEYGERGEFGRQLGRCGCVVILLRLKGLLRLRGLLLHFLLHLNRLFLRLHFLVPLHGLLLHLHFFFHTHRLLLHRTSSFTLTGSSFTFTSSFTLALAVGLSSALEAMEAEMFYTSRHRPPRT